jgi:hypothetical protein
VHYQKLKEKPSLRRRKGVQGQLRTVTTVQWMIFAEKYKPGMCFTYGNRDHWSDIATQILKKSKISTLLSPFNTGINLESQISDNTTKRSINLYVTTVLKLSSYFNENIYHKTKPSRLLGLFTIQLKCTNLL